MTAAVAAVGFERIDTAWWLDIAQQLIDAAVEWCQSAALMDLRFWEGQIRLGRRRRLPSRRQLAERWRWTGHRVRTLLKGEGWHDPHHPQPDRAHLRAAQTSPRLRPDVAQNPPSFEPVSGVEAERATQNPPTFRPDSAQTSPHARTTHYTEHTTQTGRPAEAAQLVGPEDTETLLAAVAGHGRGMLWADLVRDLEAAGYSTLQQLADAGRDTVADDLGRSASSRRLDRIRAALESRQLSVDLWHPPGPHSNASAAGRPADGLSLNRGHHPRGRRRLSGLWAETPEETQQRRLANARAAALGGVQ